MIKFVLIIIFFNFADDIVIARQQQVLTHQRRFIELRSGPELSEDEGDEGGGDDDAGADDEVEMSAGEAGPRSPTLANPRDAETEENLRLDAWSIIRNLDEFLIVQNQRLMDSLYGNAFEQNEEMEEVIYDLADNMDHWAYRVYSKFQKLNTALEDSRYTSAKTAIIAIDGQIRKARGQLKILQGNLYSLQDKLPDEEEQCAQFYTCKECLMNDGCGWCPLNDQCVAGDENGPLFAQCQHYNYQFCQGKQCLQYSACNTCLSDPDCGWCQVDEENIRVCLQQPRNFEGCPEGSWYHIAGKQFACPFKKRKEIMEEEVPTHKFWKRPDQKPPECKPIDEAMKRKIQKQRQQYNDKSEYNSDQRQNKEVQIHFKNTLQQKIVQINVMIEELEERKEQIQAWLQQYMQERGIVEEEVPERPQDQGEETPQEQQQESGSGASGGGGGGADKIQVKKSKKKKIVQIFPEEVPSPEEEIFQEQDLAEAPEETIEDGEEDVEYVFEVSKDFKVDFREPYLEKKIKKQVNHEEIEDQKYRDQGDREIEGEIEYYRQQRKQHLSDFQKYYHPK